ncbi:Ti-type conjugative transfer relaxase TraA (plasmid) [Sphingobium sp. SJ10-10]|uniref:Ti-type conjugative transfer relaxase TraA n=1 Tax=Sphingobium sp. SJ10-10 TaxID=3114999 RepID=UPI002E17BC6B|nr:Ti-type conjugative transfer relaxase TraA [Sphingobium sp. SJ10-10]
MAIYHFSAKIISRANGSSAVASAAYRSASELYDKRLGRDHNFSNKAGVIHSEVMLPEGAPERLNDRTTLWNEVEAGEKRKDAQLAREVEFSIPRELNQQQGVQLAREFVEKQFVDRGMVADLNVHWDYAEDGSPKPHAHVMLSMREVGPEGFGQKVRDWNRTELLQGWREAWADHVNERLAELDIDARIDHRTLEAQGIELEPQHKIGPAGSRRLDRGEDAERADDHLRIARDNGEKIIARPEIALDAITRSQATFTRRDLAMFVHRHSDGKEQFDQAMSAVRTSPELVALGTDGKGEDRFTSRDMIAVENRLERVADRLADRGGHGLPAMEQSLRPTAGSEGLVLGGQQEAALAHIIGEKDIAIVVGYAGTGKSAMLGVARDEWERAGYQVRGAALSGIAAEGLEGGSGIQSRTIASMEYQWEQGRELLGPRDVLVIDEAGMIGTRQMERVLGEAERAGAKVVLVGDAEQLQAIEAGAAFRSLAERHGAAEISEVRRQHEDWQKDATKALATGRTGEAIHVYAEHGMVHAAETREQARAELIDRWDAQRRADPDKSRIILTHTNAEVRDLNEAARDRLRDAGDPSTGSGQGLGEDVSVSTERGARDFAEGDRIMFLKNERGLGVKNGTLGVIEKVSPGSMAVRLDDGRRVAFDLKDYAHVDHGYAATIHKSQGVTVDQAHVLATPGMDRHAAYVGLSRHREGVQLHYGRDDFADQRQLTRTLSRERAKDMASDYPVDRDAEVRAFADRRGLSGEIRFAEPPERAGVDQRAAERGSSRQEREDPRKIDRGEETAAGEGPRRRGMFDGFRPASERPSPATDRGQGDKPKRGMFDGLKLSVARTPARGQAADRSADRTQDRDYARAVERVARSAQTIAQAHEKGAPVLEHQKVALEHARGALEQIRPGSSRDMIAAAERNPGLVRDAAAGRSGPMIDAMAHEAKVRADPNVRADRFVERWQGLRHQRGAAERAGDHAGAEKAGKAMQGMAKGLERDPQVESLLKGRSRELGLQMEIARGRSIGVELVQQLDISRDRGMSR